MLKVVDQRVCRKGTGAACVRWTKARARASYCPAAAVALTTYSERKRGKRERWSGAHCYVPHLAMQGCCLSAGCALLISADVPAKWASAKCAHLALLFAVTVDPYRQHRYLSEGAALQQAAGPSAASGAAACTRSVPAFAQLAR
eukprot:1160921-Pelagomonas_calceolata.AAC.18